MYLYKYPKDYKYGNHKQRRLLFPALYYLTAEKQPSFKTCFDQSKTRKATPFLLPSWRQFLTASLAAPAGNSGSLNPILRGDWKLLASVSIGMENCIGGSLAAISRLADYALPR